jgi:hypothetical protein
MMSTDDNTRVLRKDLLVAAVMVAAGTALSGFALAQLRSAHDPQIAQATQPLQSSPPSARDDAPAESKPGGTRPTTPAPEPARPDAKAQRQGAKPALPPAPAEKMAPPIQEK